MKKKKILASGLLGISVLAAGVTLTSCDMTLTPSYEQSSTTTTAPKPTATTTKKPTTTTTTTTVQKVTVTFNSNGGTQVAAQSINKGGKVTKPTNPTKASVTEGNKTTTYTFGGWYTDTGLTKAFDFNTVVNANTTLYAKWNATITEELTVTFNTMGGSSIQQQKVIKGNKVARPTNDPTKNASAQFTYSFAGWYKDQAYTTVFDFANEVINANTTIYAKWTEITNKYDVTWKNGDTVLKTEKVAYGKTPVYSGSTPTKAADVQYSYTFIGWTPEVDAVTKAITYTATFKETTNKYKVTWLNYDGNQLDFDDVEYDQTPEYFGAEPLKPSDDQYDYTFIAWTPTISKVTGDVTYTATFTETLREYTVTFYNGDDEFDVQTVEYGSKPTTPDVSVNTPTKASTIEKQYTFKGWALSPDGDAITEFDDVTGETEYYAVFDEEDKVYTVKWNNYDGSKFADDSTWTYSQTAPTITENPSKTQTTQYTYAFDHWNFEPNVDEGIIVATPVFTSTVRKYTVTWMNGTAIETDLEVEYGSIPQYNGETPTKTATVTTTYTFDGWYDAETDGNKLTDSTIVEGNVTYYARFTEATRKYTYRFMDGSSVIKSEEIEYGTAIVKPESNPTKEDSDTKRYTFEGWYDAETGGNKITTFGNISGDVTYYARYTEQDLVKVYFVLNGGYIEFDDFIGDFDVKVLKGSSVSKPQNNPFKFEDDDFNGTIKYYSFAGWYTSTDGGQTLSNTEFNFSTILTSNITLYAKYNETIKYEVTYMKEDGVTEHGYDEITAGQTIATAPTADSKTGYKFDKWCTRTGQGTELDPYVYTPFNFGTDTITGPTTLYATYTIEKYDVLFYSDNGVSKHDEALVEYGNKVTQPATNPTKSSSSVDGVIKEYTFAGWYTRSGEGTNESPYVYTAFNFDTIIVSDTKLYAQYNETTKYEVTFMKTDGVTKISSVAVVAGGKIASTDVPTPEDITGYTFIAWCTRTSNVEPYVSLPFDFAEDKINAVTTLYATYNTIKYDITYNGVDGATFETANPTKYNILDEITLNNPTKDGYTFAGWKLGEAAPVTTMTIAKGTTGVKTFTATWTLVDYSLTYDLAGGALEAGKTNPTQYTIETPTFTLNNPTKNGYTFVGWKLGDANPVETVTIAKGTTGAKSYKAIWALETYTIQYDLDGGTVATANPTQYTVVTDTFTLNNPTKNGYTFAGWTGTDLDAATTSVTIAQGLTGNRTYTAIWLQDYTITYNLTGGALASGENPVKYNKNTDDFTLINPEKNGYTFAGWTGTDLTDPTETVTVVKGSIGNRTYTATWTAIEYDITLRLADGTTTIANPTKYTIETADFTLINPTKEGYTFAGWTGTGLSNATKTVTIVTGTTGALEFTATYTAVDYAIVLHLADGTTATANPTQYTIESEDITLINPTKEGYTFAGWKLGTGAGEDSAQQTVTIAHGSTGAKEYTATYTAINYAITYDLADGAVATANPTTYTIESADITLNNPTKNGYIFAGWTGTGLDAATMNVTIPLGSTGDRTYTATWTPKAYNITYTLNGGTETTNPATYNIESENIILAQPTKEDYEFAGWTYEGQTTPKKDVTIETGSTGDKSYTANWNAIITFNTDEATINIPKTQKILINGTNKIVRPVNNPAKYGYEFDDWYLENATNPYNFDAVVTTSLTLYAKWTLSQAYTVTFDSNEGSAVTEQTVMGGYTASEPVSPTRENKEFVGWFTKDGTNDDWGDQWNFTTNTVNADMTLYAKWDNVKYTVKFNSKGGSAVASQRVEINTKVTKPQDPTRTGYKFVEWTLNSAAFDFATYEVTGDITLIAKWEVATFTVKFETNGGSTIDDRTDVEYDSQIVVANPTKTGYVFAGWYSDEQLTQEFDLEIESIQSNITLYADWKLAKYVVEFDTDGGTAISSQMVEHGKVASKPTNNPTKEGYTFKGWFVSVEENAEEFDFASPITGATTIYAKWDENQTTTKYTITFMDGTTEVKKFTGAEGDKIEFPTATELEKSGYQFVRYYYDENFAYEFEENIVLDENLTIYLRYMELNKEGVTYVSNAAELIACINDSTNKKYTIYLTNDIDMSGVTYNGISSNFNSSVYGYGYKIMNWNATYTSNKTGFFGVVYQGTLDSIVFKNCTVSDGKTALQYIGLMAGQVYSSENISRIVFENCVMNTEASNTLGLLGEGVANNSNQVLEMTYIRITFCSVAGTQYVGGLFGRDNNAFNVTYLEVFGLTINPNKTSIVNSGGLVGKCSSTITIDTAYVNLTFNGASDKSDQYNGGLIGYIESTGSVILKKNIDATITALISKTFGGIVGYTKESSQLSISDSAIDAKITTFDGADGTYVGGVIGLCQGTTSLNKVNSTVDITAQYSIGGIIGETNNESFTGTNIYVTGKIKALNNAGDYENTIIGHGATNNIDFSECYYYDFTLEGATATLQGTQAKPNNN